MKYFTIVALLIIGAAVISAQEQYCSVETSYTPCPRCTYRTQDARDACYMREALRFGTSLNPLRPYGALVVDHVRNVISCYGVNSGNSNVLLHGEIAAFNNCTALYPSPTGNDRTNPGLNWANQTMYTSAEPCGMCSHASIWRGLGRMVYGTDIPTLVRIGSKQIFIRARDVYEASALSIFKTGAQGAQGSNYVPFLREGVLQEECDRAFYTAFGFQYPPTNYKSCEDVFSLDYGKCSRFH